MSPEIRSIAVHLYSTIGWTNISYVHECILSSQQKLTTWTLITHAHSQTKCVYNNYFWHWQLLNGHTHTYTHTRNNELWQYFHSSIYFSTRIRTQICVLCIIMHYLLYIVRFHTAQQRWSWTLLYVQCMNGVAYVISSVSGIEILFSFSIFYSNEWRTVLALGMCVISEWIIICRCYCLINDGFYRLHSLNSRRV